VRFAAHSAGIKVKNLGQNVSNELLHRAFERFGEIDKAVVVVDDKGRPCGEGIVYFSRKPAAMQALHRVNEGIFLLGQYVEIYFSPWRSYRLNFFFSRRSPRPVVLELLEEKDVEDGMPEVHVANRVSFQK
jgi:RNA recognition motif-containing protein